MDSEERWERIANTLLGISGFFAALTVYGIWNGEGIRGSLMTIIPAVLVFVLWRVVRARWV